MSFSTSVRNEAFVKSARHCCACHLHKGRNLEIHHILPKEQGGQDTFENAIVLCFECHADAGHYFAGHPKGSKFSIQELIMHRDNWYRLVELHQLKDSQIANCELIHDDHKFKDKFTPSFLKKRTVYGDRKARIKMYELIGMDPMIQVNERKANNKIGYGYLPNFRNVNTYDDYLDYINGDFPNSPFSEEKDDDNEIENIDCQPIRHCSGSAFRNDYVLRNKSNCILKLRFKNSGIEVIEDFKIYLKFENIVIADSIDKNDRWDDMTKYNYNVRFLDNFNAEFVPGQNVLVQNDSIVLDTLCFRTFHTTKLVKVHWEMFARNCHQTGTLEFQINPKIKRETKEKLVYNPENFQEVAKYYPDIVIED